MALRSTGPNYLEYNIVLDACASAGRLDLAMQILDELHHESGIATAEHITLAMKAAAIAGDGAATARMWKLCLKAGFQVRAWALHSCCLCCDFDVNNK